MSQSESRALLPDWHQRTVRWKVSDNDWLAVLYPWVMEDEASRVESLSASTTDKGGTPQPQLDLSFTQSGSKPHRRSMPNSWHYRGTTT